MENLALLWGIIGPGVSGAIFGAGWWFWVDAVVCSAVQVSFLHYLPGIFATLAALMFNCVNKDEIGYDYYSPYGDDSEWRVKLWLFVAYVVSFVCLAGSVGLLVQDALTNKGPSVWTGVAGVLQCVLVLISGLVLLDMPLRRLKGVMSCAGLQGWSWSQSCEENYFWQHMSLCDGNVVHCSLLNGMTRRFICAYLTVLKNDAS
ncbi:uncharacterized protein [Miscanthus floridulus]|uniref:uncharacterized protein n=1 Tax=Miscanthus floridulus TaxID=154761 RepID=UPI0034588A7D